jgi:ABC-type arginine/histidine transport system permease subunit
MLHFLLKILDLQVIVCMQGTQLVFFIIIFEIIYVFDQIIEKHTICFILFVKVLNFCLFMNISIFTIFSYFKNNDLF